MGSGLRLGTFGVLLALAVTACGAPRQDANEPSGVFDVDVVKDSFPLRQHIAQQSRLRIQVRNAGDRTIPDIAVTVRGLSRRDPQPGLADPNKPIWIIDSGPLNGDTAYVGTWALGKLAPGRSRTFEWRVTPTIPGLYNVNYEVAAGLDGKAKARGRSGGPPKGSFTVRISGAPPDARVDPATGRVVREQH